MQSENAEDLNQDTAAIEALMRALGEAWTRGDEESFAALFTEDVDYVTFDGSRIRGRADNARMHAQLFRTVLRGTRLYGKVESVRFVSPDVAVVHGVGGVLWPWESEVSKRALSRNTMVVAREGGVFRITAFQNTRVHPLPEIKEGSFALTLFRLWVRVRTALTGPRAARPSPA